MNSPKEFLEELAEELRYLPAKEVNDILKHYKEKINVEIDYGTPLEKIFESLKSPKEIAKGIYEMHGVDYVKKRKTATKIVDVMIAVVCSLLILACLSIFVVGLIFIGTVIVNQFSLIIYAFKFKQTLDTIITTIFVLAYIVVMLCSLIYVVDLFIILINSLIKKVLSAFKATRGKYYSFMDFTLTMFFNQITKTNKFILKVLSINAIIFVAFAITSYATKGYMYRSMNSINSSVSEATIEEQFTNITVNSTNSNFTIIEDENITKPIIKYEYELTKMEYTVENGTLNIDVAKKKIYDILGLIKAPVPNINIFVPKGYNLDKIDLDIEYGNLIFKQLTSTNEINVITTSGNISLGKNENLKKVNIELYDGTLTSNKNIIDELTIDQKSGNMNAGEDQINNLTHTNGSSQVIMVNSTINKYKLNNSSGTIYLEKLTGDNFDMLSNTSVNSLYDFNYDTAKILVQNTGNVTLIRSYFKTSVEVTTVSNSYQTVEYVKSPKITLASASGLISCNKINKNYTKNEIMDLAEEYRSYATTYNGYELELDNSEIFIEANSADVTVTNIIVNQFKYLQKDAASLLENIQFIDANIEFGDTASNIKNLNGENVKLIINSTSFSSKSSIDISNTGSSKLVIEAKVDGMSDLVVSQNIEIKYIN